MTKLSAGREASGAHVEAKPLHTMNGAHAGIRGALAGRLASLRALRQELHQHPELSYQERRTSARVAEELRRAGVVVKTGLGKGTGVLGYLPASDPANEAKGAVALRADMDALPIVERTGKPYASTTSGVMHACGHDGHTAILLGTAQVLSAMERPRPVLLVFQPAEEGGGGAEVMVREGALEGEGKGGLGAPARVIFGLHGWPTLELGRVASKAGPLLAATDDFEVTMRGVQSHGAYPHYGRDPIVASAAAIGALQTIVSRGVGPLDSCVVSVGAIHAGTADNIIPEACTFIGTVRTLRAQTRTLAKERFFEVVRGVAEAHGCTAEIVWKPGYPVTENDAGATERFFEIAQRVLGPQQVERVEHATMGGEDFAYYGQKVPACFYLLGLKPAGAASYPTLHQPDFDFNDDALAVGVEVMCGLALGA